jgi:ABC-type molybdate transport system ATPase subunit
MLLLFYKDDRLLVIEDLSQKNPLSYLALSSSEKQRVDIEIGSKISHVYSNSKPTIFIIEHDSFSSMDKYNKENLLNIINNSKLPFQILLTAYNYNEGTKLNNFNIYEHKKIKPDFVQIIKKGS